MIGELLFALFAIAVIAVFLVAGCTYEGER